MAVGRANSKRRADRAHRFDRGLDRDRRCYWRVALEYVWEVGEDTFTIWGGEVGSPASFKGRFSDDRNTISGRWEWPGGGYEATMTKVN